MAELREQVQLPAEGEGSRSIGGSLSLGSAGKKTGFPQRMVACGKKGVVKRERCHTPGEEKGGLNRRAGKFR